MLANAVVTLTGVKVTTPYPDPQVTNEGCRFVPRVQLARAGAPTKTTSKDPLLHTTNAQQDGGRTLFNVGLPVPNLVVTRPLNGPGLVRLTCNTHTWMRGFIVVTDEMAAVTRRRRTVPSSPASRPGPTSSRCGTRCSRRPQSRSPLRPEGRRRELAL